MRTYSIIEGRPSSRIVLCCEHASNDVPIEYEGLGLSSKHLMEHISWDIGAAEITTILAESLGVPAILSGASRLLVDCNRGRDEPSLIVEDSDGIPVPGNVGLDQSERDRRIGRFYEPYHDAIDEVLARHQDALLLSVHSFTPALRTAAENGNGSRSFDVGVLFDDYLHLAERFGRGLEQSSLSVRYNEPYSGLSGLIFSARQHGVRHGRRYLELELNNGRLRDTASTRSVAGMVANAVVHLLEEE